MKALWYCPICFCEGDDPEVTHCPEDGTPVELFASREARWVGKVIDDKYRVVGLIGAGGMAEVFEVERISSGKRLALKLLKSMFIHDSQLNVRFRQEAMMISLIAHRNIVTLEDFGVLPETNSSYMVMERLHGYSLGQVLKRGPLSPEAAFQIVLQTCEGMAAAHERGVIHRDLKPDNIFLHRAGPKDEPIVKILDLGIGKLFNKPTAKGVTLSGTVVGTPEYMSPEQCKGKDAGVASDIYSLGIVLYEMLFGVAPFEAESPLLVLPRHLSEIPKWDDFQARAMKIPGETKRVVLRALEKKPEDRQESMLDFQKDVAGLLSRARHGTNDASPPVETFKDSATRSDPKAETMAPPDVVSPNGVPPDDPARNDPARADTLVGQQWSALKRPQVQANATILELSPNVYWVGRRHHSQLECNPYLRVYEGNGNRISILIDPGPLRDLDVVTKNVSSVIGSIDNLNYVFISHQDPDAAGNAAEIQRRNPGVLLICSGETWRLARHYGLDEKRYIATESILGNQIGLSTGQTLQFWPTPFCQTRGATMMYDPDSAVLFSGDLFGGTSIREERIVTEQDFDGIQLFHQLYMPSQRALARALLTVTRINPLPQLIAPQHGNIISKENVHRAINMLKQLRVGMDLIEFNEQNPEILTMANEIVRLLASVAGQKAAKELIGRLGKDKNLVSQFDVVAPDRIISIKVECRRAIETLFQQATELTPKNQQAQLEQGLKALLRRFPCPSSKQ